MHVARLPFLFSSEVADVTVCLFVCFFFSCLFNFIIYQKEKTAER